MEDKMEALKKENEQLKHQQIIDKIQGNKEILGAQITAINSKQQQQQSININNNNTNQNTNTNTNTININLRGRLIYPSGIFCFLLLLNICLPGIGTIIAGVFYGNTVVPDKVGSLICRGIFQMFTCPIVYLIKIKNDFIKKDKY